MALLERVSTLVRANLNDLVDKAEHPGKDDQAGHPRHAEPASAGQDPGGDCHRRPAPAGKKDKKKMKTKWRSGCEKRNCPSTRNRTTWRVPPCSASKAIAT